MTVRITGIYGIAGTGTQTSTRPQAVRFAQSMTLYIELQESRDGKIMSPYLQINYGTAKQEDYEADKEVDVSC